jgi:hypothetical protein
VTDVGGGEGQDDERRAVGREVDGSAGAPAAILQDAAFHDAEIVRWMEWSMAGYYRIAIGLTAVLIGVAVARSRALPCRARGNRRRSAGWVNAARFATK